MKIALIIFTCSHNYTLDLTFHNLFNKNSIFRKEKTDHFFLIFFFFWQTIPTHAVGAGVGAIEGLVFEIIITFGLVYTVYATAADPKKGSLGIIAPIAIGFVVGANILAAGPFSGGSMNPARSFGPAVVSGDFSQIWIYWVGPLIGGGLAGLIYGDIFIGSYAPVPASEEYA